MSYLKIIFCKQYFTHIQIVKMFEILKKKFNDGYTL